MKANSIFDVAGGVLLVALVTSIVSSRNVASQVTAGGNAFAKVISAALGAGSVR